MTTRKRHSLMGSHRSAVTLAATGIPPLPGHTIFLRWNKMIRQKGFTLVELLVVITVIGILVALAIPNMNRLKTKAKEVKIREGVHIITTALEQFSSSHDGLYPGVASPTCDQDGVDPFLIDDGNMSNMAPLLSMRALIGGGVIKPEDPNLDFLDGFYFPIDPQNGPPPPPYQVPDRLVGDGSLEIYPENPFRTNIREVTNQAVPMFNVWGIEFTFSPDPSDPDYFVGSPAPVRICEPMWYGADGNSTTIVYPSYDFPPPGGNDVRFIGDQNNPLRYDPDQDWKVNKGALQASGFPEGQFAYIPLDPVQPDPTAADFMRFCKNYWIVIYGSTETAESNKYSEVLPHFPRPLGNGRAYADLTDFENNATAYEWTTKMALVGAMDVQGTKYEDQFRVEGS